MFAISDLQIEELRKAKLDAKHRKVASFLQRRLPDILGDHGLGEVTDFVSAWSVSARPLKLVSEQALARWCMLQLLTHGDASQDADTISYLDQSLNPEQAIEELLTEINTQLQDETPIPNEPA